MHALESFGPCRYTQRRSLGAGGDAASDCVGIQGLTISELHCTEAEMQALESRFGNDVGVDYVSFLAMVEPSPPPDWRYRSTQPCIPPGSLNRVPASAGVRAGMSPLPGGR